MRSGFRLLVSRFLSAINRATAIACARLSVRSAIRNRPGLSPPFLKILVIRLDMIGDAVLMSPFYRELKRNLPGARITALVGDSAAPLVESDPHVDQVIVSKPVKNWHRLIVPQLAAHYRLAKLLRPVGFDLIVCPRYERDERAAYVLASMVDRSRVLAYDNDVAYRGLFGLQLKKDAGGKHEVQRNLDILRSLGMVIKDDAVSAYPSSEDSAIADTLLSQLSANTVKVALGIGSSTPANRWPIGKYAELVGCLAGAQSLSLVLVVGPGEDPLAADLAGQVNVPLVKTTGLTLLQLAALLRKCDLFVGNDSGPGHIAAGVGCRTVTVFSHWAGAPSGHRKSPERFRPWGDERFHRVVRPLTPLDGCTVCCSSSTPHCILNVGVDDVLDACRIVLNSK